MGGKIGRVERNEEKMKKVRGKRKGKRIVRKMGNRRRKKRIK